jgi:hypothetical protein
MNTSISVSYFFAVGMQFGVRSMASQTCWLWMCITLRNSAEVGEENASVQTHCISLCINLWSKVQYIPTMPSAERGIDIWTDINLHKFQSWIHWIKSKMWDRGTCWTMEALVTNELCSARPSVALKTARSSLLVPACGCCKMVTYLCGWVRVHRCIGAYLNKYGIPQHDWCVTLRQCDIAASMNPPIRVNRKRHSASQTSVQRQYVTFTLPAPGE